MYFFLYLSNSFVFNQLQKIGEHLVSTRLLESKNIDFQRYKGMVRVPSIPLSKSKTPVNITFTGVFILRGDIIALLL